MNMFWIVIFLLAGIYFFTEERSKSQKWWYICICTIMLILTCVRSIDIGFDSRNYADYFLWFRKQDLRSSFTRGLEPGYTLLNRVIGLFSDNEQLFVAIVGIITLIPLFLFMWKRSSNPILSLLIFVVMEHWFSVMGIFRQWCAIAVLTAGYDCIVKRKLIPFLFCILIAYTFHQTALFFLPLYFVYQVRITPFFIFLCMGLAVAIGVLSEQIVDVISIFARNELLNNIDGGMTFLIVLWVIAVAIIVIAEPVVNENEAKLNYIALVYSAVIQPLSLSYSGFARIHLYCWFGLVLVIPQVVQAVSRSSDRRNTLLFKMVIIILLMLWYRVTCGGNTYALMW